ncbi:MAG: mercuric reductase [Pseudomonadota bacterium]
MIWIGTGQATLSTVPKLVAAGKTVAIVESGRFGGTCVNTGCTPTKTLVASAYAINMARRGHDFGFSTQNTKLDFSAAMDAQNTIRNNGTAMIERRLEDLTQGALLKGRATFVSPNEVQVGADTIRGNNIVIHTGTRPFVPPIEGVGEASYLTNESILDLNELPKHLVIVGGGYIALEFGQIFKRFGSDVTILERSERLLPREDSDVASAVQQVLSDEGIEIKTGCEVSRVSGRDRIQVDFIANDRKETVIGSHLLLAVGRSPNSADLNLKNADVRTNDRGFIPVTEEMRTSASHIFALGDINGRGAFTHTSVNDGQIFWEAYQKQEDIADNQRVNHVPAAHRQPIYSMFIDPPLARVGMSEADVAGSGRRALIATMPMAQIARAREKRETHGMVKIIVDADNEEILGATIFGTSGDEVIGMIAAHMQLGATYRDLQRLVLPHPTVSELIPWVLNDLKPLST